VTKARILLLTSRQKTAFRKTAAAVLARTTPRCRADAEHSDPHGRFNDMPVTITIWLVLVWFCVGFFAGLGWHLAGWTIGRMKV
jgi:hypothetical protein